MSKTKTFYPIYKRILGAVFILWLFLWLVEKFGFSFGLDLPIFFRAFLFLFFFLLVSETKKRWSLIYPAIREITVEIGDKIWMRIKSFQEEALIFLPRDLANKASSVLSLTIAVVFLFFFGIWQIIGQCLTFLFSQNGIFLLTILGIIIDIFIFNFFSDLIVLLLSILLMVTIRLRRIKGNIVVTGGLIFLFLCSFLSIFETKPLMVEKVAIWAYVFLAIGSGQLFFKSLKHED